jgi:hypothetical protein
MRRLALIIALAAFTGLIGLTPRGLAADGGVPRLDHIFVIILENHDYCQLLAAPVSTAPAGNCAAGDSPAPLANAPFLNLLASKNGVATDYYGTSHPSEPNYVALGGGNYFGIEDDNDYACPNGTSPSSVGCGALTATGPTYPNHTLYGDNLAQQMDDHGVSWKAYFQSLPAAGDTGNCYPSASNCLYASKHNPFINFESVQDHDLNKIVPIEQLADDLGPAGHSPRVSVIVADQCNDMHGLGASSCGTTVPSCANSDAQCIQAGDAYTKMLVGEIRSSNSWKHGNDAIVITVDEGNTNLGCCDAGTSNGGGGGNVATIVVTNHDARHPDTDNDGFTDNNAYNHYSLMATIEGAFDLGCVQNTCDTGPKGVHPMTPLLRDP